MISPLTTVWQCLPIVIGSKKIIAAGVARHAPQTLEECEDAYLNPSKRIFQPKRGILNKPMQRLEFVEAHGKFDSQFLTDAIKEAIRNEFGNENICWRKKTQSAKCKELQFHNVFFDEDSYWRLM